MPFLSPLLSPELSSASGIFKALGHVWQPICCTAHGVWVWVWGVTQEKDPHRKEPSGHSLEHSVLADCQVVGENLYTAASGLPAPGFRT